MKQIALLLGVLMIPLAWMIMRAGEPEALPEFASEYQRKSALKSCIRTNPCELELNELLRMSDTFHGTHVKTAGFLLLEFESNSLFENTDDYTNFNFQRGVGLRVPTEIEAAAPPNQSRVLVVGRYVAGGKTDMAYRDQHHGMFPGRIDVELILASGT